MAAGTSSPRADADVLKVESYVRGRCAFRGRGGDAALNSIALSGHLLAFNDASRLRRLDRLMALSVWRGTCRPHLLLNFELGSFLNSQKAANVLFLGRIYQRA
jgi:hypothetical protein